MNPRRPLLAVLFLAALAAGACAGATTGEPRTSPNRITQEQLANLDGVSAYDAIQRLRPAWLQPRGTVSLRGGSALPRVHLNDSPTATLDMLRSLPATEVDSMEFMNAADATTRFGTGYPGGLIQVRTRR